MCVCPEHPHTDRKRNRHLICRTNAHILQTDQLFVLKLYLDRGKSLDKAPGERTDVIAQLKTSVRSLGGLSRDLSRSGHIILQTEQLLVLLLIAIAKFN